MADLPAIFARGGTSKGLFFETDDLPADAEERDALLCRAMGSPDSYQMQLNGMGGGISSLSKVVFVSKGGETGVDVDYTFGQVAVDSAAIDYSANCGNLTSAVAPFALYRGVIARPPDGVNAFKLRNMNIGSLITARFTTRDGVYEPSGAPSATIPGVTGSGCAIDLAFEDPGTVGATPTGGVVDQLSIDGRTIRFSVVFASAPVVFVPAGEIGLESLQPAHQLDGEDRLLATLDHIRRHAAVAAGLARTPDVVALASPKIAIVFEPHDYTTSEHQSMPAADYDVGIQMVSMERPHRSITLTGAMCTAAAAAIDGTIVAQLGRSRGDAVRIGQPAGVMEAGAIVSESRVKQVSVVRTARLLMSGHLLA